MTRDPKILTTSQAAALLGRDERTVVELCHQGHFRGAQLWQRRWMIPASAVQKFLANPTRILRKSLPNNGLGE